MNQVTYRYKMKLFPIYEGNRPSGLGGDREQTHRQTNRGVTSINKIDEHILALPLQSALRKHTFMNELCLFAQSATASAL